MNTNVYLDYVPETIYQCRTSYIPPIKKYITCNDFGKSDGMDGCCHWCMEMFPYQFEMCHDESHIKSHLVQGEYFNGKIKTREDAIKMIHSCKSKCKIEEVTIYNTYAEYRNIADYKLFQNGITSEI